MNIQYTTDYQSNKFGAGTKHFNNADHQYVVLGKTLCRKKYVLQFINTGYTTTAEVSNMCVGKVKDYYAPSVFGVGFLSKGKYRCRNKGVISRQYVLWQHMIERCYAAHAKEQFPSYYGKVTVCKDWHNFQRFCSDIEQLEGYSEWVAGKDYVLDKDIKGGGKEYSIDNCMFVIGFENL